MAFDSHSLSQNTKTINLSVEAQGRLLKCRVIVPFAAKINRSTSVRGDVTMFTRKSRKRLLERAARLDSSKGCTFITLTYGQQFPLDSLIYKAHLFAFLKRIRRLHPAASGVWRLEFQKRGAPHFHLMLYNCPYIPKAVIAKMWSEVIGDEYCDHSVTPSRPPMTRIEWCGSPKKVTYYLSKYVAKDSGFNTVPYLTATTGEVPRIGRFWGCFNRLLLPYCELVTVIITYSRDWYAQFKRAAHYKFVRISKYSPNVGFSLFVTNPRRWLDYCFYCLFNFAV